MIAQRFMHRWAGTPERNSEAVTNLGVIAIIGVASLTIGLKTYLLIQLPVMLIAGAMGVWLFYIQHQFDGVYWSRHVDWDPVKAALKGSSYYKLPRLLQWFSGNIGFHHAHHVLPRIPNYNLQECHNSSPILQTAPALTLRKSLKSVSLNLWDDKLQKLVSFKSLSTQV